MNKPLTTLGAALAAKGTDLDWRAQLRQEGIPRRPPPPSTSAASSRPDRGYVEQPEERRETTQIPRPAAKAPKPPSTPMPNETAPFMRRRVETPRLDAPVALVRFVRDERNNLVPFEPTVSKPPAANDAPPPSAPEEATMPKGVERLAADGRRLFTQEFRDGVLKAFDERPEGVTQKAIAERNGIHQTVLSAWVSRRDTQRAKEERESKRLATRAANKAAAASGERTLVSAPPSNGAAATKPRGVRSFETVSLELAGALAKVAELKRELRALLGDD
jgi:hypothetical protein